jgi:cell division protein FtsW
VFLNQSIDPLNISFQIKQALIAVGSGGLFGVGFGKSIQKFGYLPEVQGDTIFAAAAEELGFVRILFLVLAYLFIAYKGFGIAKRAPDRFSMLVAVGITGWFVFQAFINIGVNIALLPLTGLTLPFVSYGGSSLIANMMGAGILLNISRYAQEKTHTSYRRRVGGAHYAQPRHRY